jgi:hypothetical protein
VVDDTLTENRALRKTPRPYSEIVNILRQS